ncbi:hypothetical protein OG799_21575 [Micromonospora sp. NBC_00898]|uniref:hypothetical protein n=1 Tax=Micromonospora sp. NBC_00898 TaxID=2975981 RepID=UPI00386F43F4|nr:hypothetical protein OG799_21575 [Micromonospora sp. NBC_00898]
MQICLLGPLEVRADSGTPVEVGGAQALVSRLRRAAPGLPVEARPGGYRLETAAEAVRVTLDA